MRGGGVKAGSRAPGMRAHLRAHPEWLLVLAALTLMLYFYLARLQAVGVATGQGWAPITGGTVSVPLHFAAAACLLALIPLAAARWGCGFAWRELGLGIGRWREGLVWIAVGIPIAALAARLTASSPDMLAMYPLDRALTRDSAAFTRYALFEGLYYVPWEVLFRGVLLFGLRQRLGTSGAIAAQTALSVVAHFGSPFGETLAALPAGLLFGWLALRLRSIWPMAVVHWTVGVAVDWFALAAR